MSDTLPNSTEATKRTEGDELVHALRNTFCAMQYGVRALEESRLDEPAFKAMHDTLSVKLKMMKELLAQAARLLEADQGHVVAPVPIRVLCVDDSPDITMVMRIVIESAPMMECVGCLSSADHLVEEARRLTAPPNPKSLVVLLDATMPGKNPLAAMSELATDFPEIKMIIYSAHDDEAFIDRAMDAGAWGCVSKNDHPDTVLRIVREVAAGNAWWPPRPDAR